MDSIAYFESALALGMQPTLLEFTHPRRKTPFVVCGIKPVETLEVRNNLLYKNGEIIGAALDIFSYLTPTGDNFFPAYLGFFAYEFSGYFGKATSPGERLFPDALFRRYEQGLIIDDGRIVHFDPLPKCAPKRERHACNTLTPSLSKLAFLKKVTEIKERIRAGDVYQVNISMPFYFDACDEHMVAIFRTMRAHNKSPFMGIMQHDNWWILSGSPERLFATHDQMISTRPIAGTKRREFDRSLDDNNVVALQTCAKENAEHAMLVDLMRNDLNLVANPGTVLVSEDRSVEFYSHVMHLVSEVSAKTAASLADIFRAVFPSGTITGAPKVRVMETIADLESLPRGPYTGALGYVSSVMSDFNILIRSMYRHGDQTWISAGAGIVIDSVPTQEWAEVHRKAQAIKDILENKSMAKPARAPLIGPSRMPIHRAPVHPSPRVRFLENNDSFSFTIIDALQTLGATVELLPSGKLPTHIVIGPGPGNPETMGSIAELIAWGISHRLPILGICLGHQAIGHYFGSRIIRINEPIHGKSHAINHFGRGLFKGLESPAIFTRYHSLAIDGAPPEFTVDAYTDDDCIMAITHKTLPIFGIQFHPESYLSEHGYHLLERFLQTTKLDAII